MGPSPNKHCYVDRGNLDRRVRAALDGGTHVAIHGESKHGKSWLRAKTLSDDEIARVQCLPGMTASQAIEQALGRLEVYEEVAITVERSSGVSARQSGALTAPVVRIGSDLEISENVRQAAEHQPVGGGRRDLGWVAEHFRTGGRTPVFEDFHNLDHDNQFAMAYIIKGLGEWGVPCVVVGIWTDTHLLKLHNGELDGRIEDLALHWRFDELQEVARRGCRALKVRVADEMCRSMAHDAYSSVGLLQELCKATLRAAGIERQGWRWRDLRDEDALKTGRAYVVEQIAGRFDPFMQRLPSIDPDGLRPGFHRHLARAIRTGLGEQDLVAGVPVDDLVRELSIDDVGLEREQVLNALRAIDETQRSIDVRPAVLAFDHARERLVLADRRFLLYLRERPPR